MDEPSYASSASSQATVALRPKQGQDSRPKRSRVSTHKVRTGCLTCKKRHVKCDEARPHCGNCIRSRRQCEGYPQPKKGNIPGLGQFFWNVKAAAHRPASPTAQQHLNRDALDFRDAGSRLYFDEFVRLVQGPWVTAASGTDLWNVLLPQISRRNSTLRHAAMAIGALSMWHCQSEHGSLNTAALPANPAVDRDSHYFQAISHYGRSLKLQSQQASVQDAVFLSVLLLFFESLRGNRTAALDHINHGLALLLSLVADSGPDSPMLRLAPDPKPLLASVSEIFSNLAPHARLILPGRLGSGLPLPHFTRRLLDKNHTLESFLVLLSHLPHSTADLSRIPARFKSLDEFQEYWAAASWNQVTVGPLVQEAIKTSNITKSTDEESFNNFLKDMVSDPRFVHFYTNSRSVLKAIDEAFTPLFNEIMLSDNRSPMYVRAVHLRLQFLGVYIIDNMPQYLDAAALSSQTPFFREYLSLAEVAVGLARQEADKPAHQLALQRSSTLHLSLIALFCRDTVVREHATELLRDYPGQDGIFNPRALYVLALRNRKIERQNTVEGTPDEQWRRLWRREYLFEDGGDRIVLRYLEKNGATGQWELVEEVAEVKGVLENVTWERRPASKDGKLLMGELITL